MEATQGSPTADPPSEGPIYGPHPVNPLSGSSDGQGQDVGDNKVPNQGNKGTSKEIPKELEKAALSLDSMEWTSPSRRKAT